MPATKFFLVACLMVSIASCNNNGTANKQQNNSDTAAVFYDTSFQVAAQSFADIQVLRYEVPGFDQLSLQQKQLAYYLYEAALAGRDIFYDQKSKYGIMLRKTLEAIPLFPTEMNSDANV